MMGVFTLEIPWLKCLMGCSYSEQQVRCVPCPGLSLHLCTHAFICIHTSVCVCLSLPLEKEDLCNLKAKQSRAATVLLTSSVRNKKVLSHLTLSKTILAGFFTTCQSN